MDYDGIRISLKGDILTICSGVNCSSLVINYAQWKLHPNFESQSTLYIGACNTNSGGVFDGTWYGGWTDCSGPNYKQPSSNACISSYCPTGFRPNIELHNTCDTVDMTIFNWSYDNQILWTSIYNQTHSVKLVLGSDHTIKDDHDPIPVQNKGLYFEGLDDHCRLRGAKISSSFTVMTWVRIIDPGISKLMTFLFLANGSGADNIQIGFNVSTGSTYSLFSKWGDQSQTSDNTVSFADWHHLVWSFDYDNSTQQYNYYQYTDVSRVNSGVYDGNQRPFHDILVSEHPLGYYSGTDYLKGLLYHLKIMQIGITTLETLDSHVVAASPWNCDWNTYSSSWEPWDDRCSEGCVRGGNGNSLDCKCQDPNCSSCIDYDNFTCTREQRRKLSTCPSGFSLSGASCLVSDPHIVDWDMTWIARPMYNYAPGMSTNWRLSDPPGSWNYYAPGLPYKLRGTWFGDNAGAQTGVYAVDLHLHTVFSMVWWLKLESSSGTQTVFSKDKGDSDVNLTEGENVWEYRLNGGKPELKIWVSSSWETETTGSVYVTDTNWYFLALSVNYNGSSTTAKFYYNGNSAESLTFPAGVLISDQAAWTDSGQFWIGSGRSTDGIDYIPENPMTGFMYYCQIHQEELSLSAINAHRESNTANCYGLCQSGHCPVNSSIRPVDNQDLNQCLWESDRDQWQAAAGTYEDCYIKATYFTTQDLCPAVQGCRRTVDCNRCNDILCKSCNNFDDKYEYCTQWITNASFEDGTNSTRCLCDDNYFFDDTYPLADPLGSPPDYTDKWVDCDISCASCSSISYKACMSCRTNYWKQESANTCLDFCPTGYTDMTTRDCLGSPGSNVVFHLKLESWKDDFQAITELIGGEDILQLGSNDGWSAVDPWFDIADTMASVQFTASNSQYLTILSSSSGYPGLLLNDDFSILIWINPNVVTGTQTLLSKTNTSSNVTAIGEEKLIELSLNGANFQVVFTTSTLRDNPSHSPPVTEDFQENTYVSTGDKITSDEWQLISLSKRAEGTADIKFFQNGSQLHVVSPQPDIQFADNRNSETIIGCGKEFNNSSVINCYDGYIYEMKVYAINLASFAVVSEYTNSFANLPDLTYKCLEKEYADFGSDPANPVTPPTCTPCNTVESSPTRTDTIWECSYCGDIKCNQCIGQLGNQCTSCIPGQVISSIPGSCACSPGQYFDLDLRDCQPCASACDVCWDKHQWTCSSCSSGHYMQPDTSGTFTCTDICPKGYSTSGTSCVDSGDNDLLLDFEVINWSDRKFTYDGVDYTASTQYTYKMRGVYFTGSDLLRLDGTFYLHGQRFSFHTWIRPEQGGTIFSKSYNDWSKPDFFDVSLTSTQIQIAITGEEDVTKTASMSGIITTQNWNFLGFTLDYDRTAGQNIITIQCYNNGETKNLVELGPTAILEKANSESAIGARLDGDGSTSVVSNNYTGFIYNMYYYGGQVKTATDMNNLVTVGSNFCLPVEGCSLWPSSNDTCLWNCDTDMWYNDDESSKQCESCPSCPTHPNAWDGWVSSDNCSVCTDTECEKCDGFYSGANCIQCLPDKWGTYWQWSSDCTWKDDEIYSISRHACEGCDLACAEWYDTVDHTHCTEWNWITNYFYYKQDGIDVCLKDCPTTWNRYARDNRGYCIPNTAKALQVDFERITNLRTNFNLENKAWASPYLESSSATTRSLAVKDRGHWFEGAQHWEIKAWQFNHTFDISAWIRPQLTGSVLTMFSHHKDSGEASAETCATTDPDEAFYVYHTDTKTYSDAKADCESSGSTLVSVLCDKENAFLMDTFWNVSMFWIGANDIDVEGNWAWEDGQPWSYTNWDGSEPNDWGSGEDCAQIRVSDGTWNDIPCTNEYQYVCKSSSESKRYEDLIQFQIIAGGYLKGAIYDFGGLKVGNTSTQTIADMKWQMVAMRWYWNGTSTTIDLWINDTIQSSATANDTYMLEYNDTLIYMGAEYNWSITSTQWELGNSYVGFIWKFEITNNWRSDSDITTDVTMVGGDACPSGTCISECDKGTWINGGVCEACHEDCTESNSALTNCVRAGNDNDCTLCDNQLCKKCRYFDAGNLAGWNHWVDNAFRSTLPLEYDAIFPTVVISGCDPTDATGDYYQQDCPYTDQNNSCTCVTGFPQPTTEDPIECGCDESCDGWTEQTYDDCISWNATYYMQPETTTCLPFCPFLYYEDWPDCTRNNTVLYTPWTLDQIDWNATEDSDPWPMKQRGHWFNGETHFLEEIDNKIFHHTMYVDAIIRPQAVTNGKTGADAQRTIFSRNKDDNSDVGIEDFFALYIREDNVLEASFNSRLVHTINGLTIDDDVWEYVMVAWILREQSVWEWNGYANVVVTQKYTKIQIFKRKDQQYISADIALGDNNELVQDGGDTWQGYIGREDDSSAGSDIQAKFFSGFIYQIAWSPMNIPWHTVIAESGWSETGSLVSEFCLLDGLESFSNCEKDTFPDTDDETGDYICTSCHISCTRGCVRDLTCSLWADNECERCNDFADDATCEQCYSKADAAGTIDWLCNDYPDGAWYSTITDICYPCHKNMATCELSSLTRQSALDKGDCIPDYYRSFENVCEDYWPTGYGGQPCADTDGGEEIFSHGPFTKFENEQRFSNRFSYRGTNDDYDNSYDDPEEPRIQYNGGLYFDGGDVLQFPPNDKDSTSTFIMSQTQTVMMIIRTAQWSSANSSEDEVLICKSDGILDTWLLYLENSTKVLKLKMDQMKNILVGDPDTDFEITFDAFVDDYLWHQLAIVSEQSGDESFYQNDFKAYVDGVQIGSTQTISDFYLKDTADLKFLFGAKYETDTINPSYRGNLYKMVINYQAQTSIDLNDDNIAVHANSNVCAWHQWYGRYLVPWNGTFLYQVQSVEFTYLSGMYKGRNCLTHWEWNEFLDSDLNCQLCLPECDQGCLRIDDCLRNFDTWCEEPASYESWTDCGQLTEYVEEQRDRPYENEWCFCIEDATYDEDDKLCKCDVDYEEIIPDKCDLWVRYLLNTEVTGYHDETFKFIVLDFQINILNDRFQPNSCAEFMYESSLLKLGTNPICIWNNLYEPTLGVYTKLKIIPGSDATFGEDHLEFWGKELYNKDTVGDCPHIEQHIAPYITFIAPPPTPVAEFTVNSPFNPGCSDLFLDATQTQGVRTLRYTWEIFSSTLAVATYLSIATWDEYKVVAVPGTEFPTPGSYTVRLTVSNWLTQVDQKLASVDVVPIDSNVLFVKFLGGYPIVKLNEQREFVVEVSQPCEPDEDDVSVPVYRYSWSQITGPVSIVGDALSSQSPSIFFSDSFPEIGTYTVKVEVRGNDDAYGETQLAIIVEPSDLYVTVSLPGGTVSLRRDLLLDGSKSYDPDGGLIDYKWECLNENNDICDEIFSDTRLNVPEQTIPAFAMEEGAYTFILTITPQNPEPGDDREAFKQLVINAVDNGAPAIFFKDIGYRIPPNQVIRLEWIIESEEDEDLIQKFWVQRFGPDVDPSHYASALNLTYLAFKINTLEQGEIYRFEIQASLDFETATGVIEFLINRGPEEGLLQASPHTGKELSTEFRFTAEEWVDPEEDFPILYGFKYLNKYMQPAWMKKPLENAEFVTTLPYAGANCTLVLLHAEDSLETSKEVYITIGIEELDLSERQEISAQAITEKANENSGRRLKADTLDIPGFINKYAVNDALTSVAQLDTLRILYDNYLADIQFFIPNTLDTSISALRTMALTDQAKNRTEQMSAYIYTLCDASHDVWGFSAEQASTMLDIIMLIHSPSKDAQIQEVLDSVMTDHLPGEADFLYGIYGVGQLKLTARRTNPSLISETEQILNYSKSKIQIPANALKNTMESAEDTITILQTLLIQYPPYEYEGPDHTKSAIVDYSIKIMGTYQRGQLAYNGEQLALNVSKTDDWVYIFIEITNMPLVYDPECVYATHIDKNTGVEIWSTDGCEVQEIILYNSTVVCRCNRLTSRFTAGENLIHIDAAALAAEVEDSAATIDGELPVMLPFLAMLLLIILLTAVYERIYIMKQNILHARQQSQMPLQHKDIIAEIEEEAQYDFDPVLVIGRSQISPQYDPVIVLDEAKLEREDNMWRKSKTAQKLEKPEDPRRSFNNLTEIDNPEEEQKTRNPQKPESLSLIQQLNSPASSTHLTSASRLNMAQQSQDCDVTIEYAIEAKTSVPFNNVLEKANLDSSVSPEHLEDNRELLNENKQRSCWSRHLLCGKCAKSQPGPTRRAILLCSVLILEIWMTGTVYYSQYAIMDDQTDDFSLESLSLFRECAVGFVCAFAGLSTTCLSAILHSKFPTCGIIISSLMIFMTTVLSAWLALIFNRVWSLVWLAGWVVCAILDLTVSQLIVMWMYHEVVKIK